MSRRVQRAIANRPEHLPNMSFDDKLKLVNRVLRGRNLKGNKLGVYVTGPQNNPTYEIKGMLPELEISGKLPLSKYEWVDLLKLDPDYQDVDKEIEDYKAKLNSPDR